MREIPSGDGADAYINDAGQIFAGHVMIEPDGTTKDLSHFSPPVDDVLAVSDRSYLVGRSGGSTCVWNMGGYGRELTGSGGPYGGTYILRSVNDAGIAVGFMGTSPQPACSDSSGEVTKLPLPDGYLGGQAFDINNSGITVGFVSKADGSSPDRARAAVWDQNRNVKLIGSADVACAALAINDAGEIAGAIGDQAVVWDSQGRVIRRISPPSASVKYNICDMNDKGELVGTVETADSIVAAKWTAWGTMVKLSSPHVGDTTYALSINNAGAIGGLSLVSEPGPRTTIVWTPK